MDFFSAIKKRRSVREYLDKPVPVRLLEEIVDAARFAATARGIQPWEFVVITDPKALQGLAALAENARFLAQAKACIAVFCSDTKYYLEDGCAATENMLLAATALGIGSCWVAGDKKPYCQEITAMLGVPASFKLVSLVSLGYPKRKDALRVIEKRSAQELIHRERF